jgi:hypothetical protein
MAKVTKHTKVIMRNEMDWEAVSISNAERLKKIGYTAVAVADNEVKAQHMILGMRSDELVERLLGNLSDENKILVKTEIAQMATDFHLGVK